MSATSQRDQASNLAKQNSLEALKKARAILDPWFRAQALSWVARFTDGDPIKIASEAANAASLCDDEYKKVAVRAWEVAALAERQKFNEASKALHEAITESKMVSPNSSKAEALTLLLHASTQIGSNEAIVVSKSLISNCGDDSHWRCLRAILDAASILAKQNMDAAKNFTSLIADEKTRKKAEKIIQSGGQNPRPFFW
ncbi:MAG: hypothetical protein PHQ60_00260 [Sideroxydans sp.]|nr:hypothetical protein [Sideroxydans sp.]